MPNFKIGFRSRRAISATDYSENNEAPKLRELRQILYQKINEDYNWFLSTGRCHPEGYIYGEFIREADEKQLLTDHLVFSRFFLKRFDQVNTRYLGGVNSTEYIRMSEFYKSRIKTFDLEGVNSGTFSMGKEKFLSRITHVHADASVNLYTGHLGSSNDTSDQLKKLESFTWWIFK